MMTVAEQVKQFGAKVKKDGCAGYYIYEGKNFTVRLNQEACETVWWEVNLWDDNVDPRVCEMFKDWNYYDTKNDLVWHLLLLDQEIEEAKSNN